jgi:catechol 2,3-dioxygenase-like lactoylglutathione lyase family enzyme
MENVIARLLQDFENGRLTRRQLVQSLAMAALAAPAAAVVSPAPAAASPASFAAPWKTMHLDHISYQVADHSRSAAFYADLMGWTINNENERQTSMTIGDNVGGIIIRNRPADAPTPPPRGDRPPLTGVINHISWGVSPWDKEGVKAELERRGLTPRVDDQGGGFESWHVLDPDGWDLQISNQTS